VIEEADYTGSTAGMIEWVRKNRPRRVIMVTECSMADNVQANCPTSSSCVHAICART
jgi:quinolinate synthase